MLPPLSTTTVGPAALHPAGQERPRRRPPPTARPSIPASRWRSRTAALISSSLTWMASRTTRRRIGKVSSPTDRVSRPSAMLLGALERRGLARGQGGAELGGARRLDADEARGRTQRAHRHGDAGDQAAAAHRTQNGIARRDTARGSRGRMCPGRPRHRDDRTAGSSPALPRRRSPRREGAARDSGWPPRRPPRLRGAALPRP